MKTYLVLLFASLSASLLAQDIIKADEYFGTMRARQIGPALMSGRINDLEGHPTDNKILYAGSAGGGVWKSTDGGVTFNPIFDKHNQSIGNIAVDPKNPDQVVWVGTGETWTRNSVTVGDGIYKTIDGGQNWTHMGLKNSERITSIEINPNNTDEIYVGVLGALWGNSVERGVYKTTDGGKNWEKIFYVNETTGCSDLVMDPKNPQILYASFWEFRRTAYSFSSGGVNSALYKSTDGGKTWNKIHNGFPAGKLGRIALAVAPSNPNILYTVLETEKSDDKGLYRSDDAGATWKKLNGDFGLVVRPFYFSRIVVDPRNPDVICKAGLMGSISKDGGKTFRNASDSDIHADVHDFWFDVSDPNRLYLCDDGGIYRSFDKGTRWDMVRGIPVSQFYHVSVDNQKPFKVYGGLQDNNSWIGPSKKPGGVENRDWTLVGQGDGFKVYPHPTNPNIVYSEMQGAEYIWRTNLEKKQVKIIKPYADATENKLRFNWNTPILPSMHKPDRLYVGSQYLHKSEDQGDNWVKVSGDLTTNDPAKQQQENSGGLSTDNSGAENHCTVFSISESYIDENILWVGTDDGNVQVTTDGAKTWTNVTPNIPGLPKNTWVNYIEPSHFDKNTAYAVFDGHAQNDFNIYVYKTTDGGKTWKSIVTKDIQGYARHFHEDYKNPNLLFLGTEAGLFISLDGGNSWGAFKNNMPPVAVHWITMSQQDDALVMATHGRGIIILDDINNLRQLTKNAVNQEFQFLDTKPNEIDETSIFGNYSRAGEYVGEIPSTDAKIVYFQKARHNFGKMAVEIFDNKGNKITDLPAGKAKGINIVNWNYRLPAPKVAVGKTLTTSALFGPTVPTGTYKVKVTKGTKVYEKDLILIASPESIHTAADRAAQNEAVMKTYKLSEELGHLVSQIDQANDMYTPVLSKLTTKSQKKQLPLESTLKELAALKETLVILKGDNYTDTAEPQLREKISSLYGELSGYLGRPGGAQLANLKNLEAKLTDAQTKFQVLKTKINALAPALSKANLPVIQWKTFEEFKTGETK